MLHGLSSSTAQWKETAERLYSQGYDVFVPRLPGHGFLNANGTQNTSLVPTAANWREWDTFIELVFAAIKHASSVKLLGFSAGGMLALKLAARYGRRKINGQAWLRHVIAISPFLQFQDRRISPAKAKWWRSADSFASKDVVAQALANEKGGIPSRLSSLPSGFRVIEPTMAVGLDCAAEEVRQATAALKKIPVGIIASQADTVAQPEAMIRFGEKVGAKLKVFDSSRRVPHGMLNESEAPGVAAEVASAMDSWL